MSDVDVRMLGNGLQFSRMEGVVIPGQGEVVSLPEPAAKTLVERKYAEYVTEDEPEAEKPKRGRKPKADDTDAPEGEQE